MAKCFLSDERKELLTIILYLEKLFFRNEGKIKTFIDEWKLRFCDWQTYPEKTEVIRTERKW